jgi:DNA gyrase/topoisomerase IV subunit A
MKSYKMILIMLLLFSFSIFSETILLIGNETIKGKIKNQSINSIKVEVNGELREISKDKILKIVYRDLTKSEEEKIRAEEESKSNSNKP